MTVKIVLKNIGKVHDANIEINGITAIAGENNTGKSTVGKALFGIFNSLYHLNRRIKSTRRDMVRQSLEEVFYQFHSDSPYLIYGDTIIDAILSNQDEYLNDENHAALMKLLQDECPNFLLEDNDAEADSSKEMAKALTAQINQVLKIPKQDIFVRFLENRMNAEFAKSIVNYHHLAEPSGIELMIKKQTLQVAFDGNKIVDAKNLMDLQTQAVYLDDPFILDELGLNTRSAGVHRIAVSSNASTHRAYLRACLQEMPDNNVETAMKQILVDKKIKPIMDKINDICHLEMRQEGDNVADTAFYEEGSQKVSIENISTGLKTFLILKQLLYTGHLQENGLLILDEPEVHLHPEWQILFAEIIVLLQKEFGMHILLTTHSPYFLRAIEVYSAKYKVADCCKYYLAELKDHDAVFEDVTTATDKIYKKLVLPFEKLQGMIYHEEE